MWDMTLSAWWNNAVGMPICPSVKGPWVRMPSREPSPGMGRTHCHPRAVRLRVTRGFPGSRRQSPKGGEQQMSLVTKAADSLLSVIVPHAMAEA
jgi:hypothetical protein